MLRGCFFNPQLLSPTALILYHISGSKSIGKIHKLLAINLCNLHGSHKSSRGARSRDGERKMAPVNHSGAAERNLYINKPQEVGLEFAGGYTLLTKRSRQFPLWLGLMVVVYGEPRSAPILNTSPRSGVGQSWFAPSLPIGGGYLQLPSWTVLSTIPTVGQGEAVSRYSVGIADWSGLSLRLSPSDTNIIPHPAPNVNRFWDKILHKVQAFFGTEIVQLDECALNRRAAALRATAKEKGVLHTHPSYHCSISLLLQGELSFFCFRVFGICSTAIPTFANKEVKLIYSFHISNPPYSNPYKGQSLHLQQSIHRPTRHYNKDFLHRGDI